MQVNYHQHINVCVSLKLNLSDTPYIIRFSLFPFKVVCEVSSFLQKTKIPVWSGICREWICVNFRWASHYMLIESYIWFIVYCFASKELIACGSANILGSFFSCFPVSGSLSRSVIQESIARTQVFKNNKLCYKQSLPVMQLLFLNLHFLFIFFFSSAPFLLLLLLFWCCFL